MNISYIRPTENFYKSYNKDADEKRIKSRKNKYNTIGDINEKNAKKEYNKAI